MNKMISILEIFLWKGVRMEEVAKILFDYGLIGAILIVVLFLLVKYAPKYLEIKLKRLEEKDYMLDSFKSVVENNSQVINNNSDVIKLNSTTIKNYTDNAHKLENKLDLLAEEVRESNKLMNETNIILKERK